MQFLLFLTVHFSGLQPLAAVSDGVPLRHSRSTSSRSCFQQCSRACWLHCTTASGRHRPGIPVLSAPIYWVSGSSYDAAIDKTEGHFFISKTVLLDFAMLPTLQHEPASRVLEEQQESGHCLHSHALREGSRRPPQAEHLFHSRKGVNFTLATCIYTLYIGADMLYLD